MAGHGLAREAHALVVFAVRANDRVLVRGAVLRSMEHRTDGGGAKHRVERRRRE